LEKISQEHLHVVLLPTTAVTTCTATEIGNGVVVADMIETTATGMDLRLHREEEEDHTKIEIMKTTDRPVMTVGAEVGAEVLAKNDHDDMLHHQPRKS
jgi:hypothetical protein